DGRPEVPREGRLWEIAPTAASGKTDSAHAHRPDAAGSAAFRRQQLPGRLVTGLRGAGENLQEPGTAGEGGGILARVAGAALHAGNVPTALGSVLQRRRPSGSGGRAA